MENNKKTNTLIIGASSKLSKQYIEKYGVHKSNFFGVSSKVQGDIKDSNITIYEYKTAKKLKNIKNIEVHCNANGWACYDTIDVEVLERRLKSFLPSIIIHKTNLNMLSFLCAQHDRLRRGGDKYNTDVVVGQKVFDNYGKPI